MQHTGVTTLYVVTWVGGNSESVIDLPLPVSELLLLVLGILCTGRRDFVVWYWRYCVLVGENLLTGTGAIVYW